MPLAGALLTGHGEAALSKLERDCVAPYPVAQSAGNFLPTFRFDDAVVANDGVAGIHAAQAMVVLINSGRVPDDVSILVDPDDVHSASFGACAGPHAMAVTSHPYSRSAAERTMPTVQPLFVP